MIDEESGGKHPSARPGEHAKDQAKEQLKKEKKIQEESERHKRDTVLVAHGKAKGFLTYDEGRRAHATSSMASPDRMEDWLSAFATEGIEILDSAPDLKGAAKRGAAAEEDLAEEEDDEGVEANKEEADEDTDRQAATGDPIRAYLRKMTSVALLTREGEIEIAKRIEDGQRRVLQVVLDSSVAVDEILSLGDELRTQKLRAKDVVTDADTDEEDDSFDEQFHVDRICKVIDRVSKLWKEQQKAWAELDAKPSAIAAKKHRTRIEDIKQEILNALLELRLHKTQVDRIVLRLKEARRAHIEQARPTERSPPARASPACR